MSVFTNDVTVEAGTTNVPVTVATPLPAGTNVIGHTINDTGSTTAVTGNVTVVQATGTNLHVVNDASAAVIGHVITDTGSTVAVSAVAGTVAVTQSTSPWVVSGTVTTTAGVSNTANTTRVATSTTAATALAANASRKQAILTTETGNTYVSLGSVATTTNYAYLLTATSTLEIPSVWTGTVSVIRASGTGNIQVVEMV